ncbi:peroxiredoxin-like 2C isoform X2 [Falco cherrug]|uniref:peroxiredoxin-like 2C isoform X2 n=1 Tax=Falco cherrug TaxID=345164 RepID=UPI0024793B11|nr:peroxiredoxin-like 2C isoform X2 [Falco cherrug]
MSSRHKTAFRPPPASGFGSSFLALLTPGPRRTNAPPAGPQAPPSLAAPPGRALPARRGAPVTLIAAALSAAAPPYSPPPARGQACPSGGPRRAMAGPAAPPPVTQQVGRAWGRGQRQEAVELREAARCLVVDADGRSVPFKALYGEQKAIVVFVRNFLCYTCKEYVEDLAKVPKAFLQPFCSLTGYTHEMYVDPQREIYKTLGMKRGEGSNISVRSPHVKSNTLLGSIRSVWRAMTGPAFDFQGDPAQQGGALILGPGNEVHFFHLDKNRLDHVPINTVLQLAGVKPVNFTNKPQIIDI